MKKKQYAKLKQKAESLEFGMFVDDFFVYEFLLQRRVA